MEGEIERAETVKRLAVRSKDSLSKRSLELVAGDSQKVELYPSHDCDVCTSVRSGEELPQIVAVGKGTCSYRDIHSRALPLPRADAFDRLDVTPEA